MTFSYLAHKGDFAMLQLVNLSNDPTDTEGLLGGSQERLQNFLQAHHLDGIEFMCCGPWDRSFHTPEMIHGFHLWFWPSWLDFWRGNEEALMEEYGSLSTVEAVFGTSPEAWLNSWQRNFQQAAECGAEYVVFHVAQARSSEVRCRQFAYNSAQVIEAVLEFINNLTLCLPEDIPLLYENLWWPGMTLLEPELARELLIGTNHACGLMLDTGHLMNTNVHLQNEQQGIDYILQVVAKLGDLADKIYGIHLHQSLSGRFTEEQRQRHTVPEYNISSGELMNYVLDVDRHQPFGTGAVKKIVAEIKPQWLVHEFVPKNFADWQSKLTKQQRALSFY